MDFSVFNEKIDVSSLRTKLKIDKSVPVILSTRSFQKVCNIDIILKCIPKVVQVYPNAVFLFSHHSANDKYKDFLLSLINRLNINDSVRLLGHIKEHKDLAKYYALADVWVSVLSGDTSPVSLTEAMACGAAPVAGDLPSIREWIKNDWNGYVVPLRDERATAEAIIKLLSDKTERELFNERNLDIVREKADHYKNMEKVEEKYFNLIRIR